MSVARFNAKIATGTVGILIHRSAIRQYWGMRRLAKELSVVSLFAGCGGLDLGFIGGFRFGQKHYSRLPFRIEWANEIDQAACRVYEQNLNHEINMGDIWDVIASGAIPHSGDVVLGGFPCQDFSMSGKRHGLSSKRGLLYRAMLRVAERVQPKVLIAENVVGLLSIPGALSTIKGDFSKIGYYVTHYKLLASDYGVPQARERIIIIGWKSRRQSEKFVLPKKESSTMTAREALLDIENVRKFGMNAHVWSMAKKNNGLQGQKAIVADAPSPTIRAEHHGNIQFHYRLRRRLSVREAARLQSFPDTFELSENQSAGYKMVGNAVPPVMAWHLARSVLEALK